MGSSSNYYSVFDAEGNKYAACGAEKDAIMLCEMHKEENFYYLHSSQVENKD